MTTTPSQPGVCPHCGAFGDALLGDGLCVRCLLGAALDSAEEEAGEFGTGATRQIGRYRLLGEIGPVKGNQDALESHDSFSPLQ